MDIEQITQWLADNWQDVVGAIGGVVIAARIIVKLTPTPKDDAFLAKLVALLKQLGLVIPDDPKK